MQNIQKKKEKNATKSIFKLPNWFKERPKDRKKFKRQLYHLDKILYVMHVDMSEHIFLFHFPYWIKDVLTT